MINLLVKISCIVKKKFSIKMSSSEQVSTRRSTVLSLRIPGLKPNTYLHRAVVEECDILIPASMPVVDTEKSR